MRGYAKKFPSINRNAKSKSKSVQHRRTVLSTIALSLSVFYFGAAAAGETGEQETAAKHAARHRGHKDDGRTAAAHHASASFHDIGEGAKQGAADDGAPVDGGAVASGKFGSEMAITTKHTAEYQSFMTPSAGGGFGISWIKWMADGVTGVLYNSYGTAGPTMSSPLMVANGYPEKESPDDQSLATLSDGSTVITWVQDGDNQRSDQFHSVVGEVVTTGGHIIRFDVTDWVQDPLDLTASQSVTALANGNFAVTWRSLSSTNASTSIKSAIFHFNGAAVSAVVPAFAVSGAASVGDHSGSMPATAALRLGGYAVAWVGSPDTANPQPGLLGPAAIHIAVVGDNGEAVQADTNIVPQTSTTTGASIDHIRPAIAALNDGGFVVTWEDHVTNADGSTGSSINAQMFSVSGHAAGQAYAIATPAAGVGGVSETSVAGLQKGGFVVTWTDHSVGSTGDSWNVVGQEFKGVDIAATSGLAVTDTGIATVGDQFTVNDPAAPGAGPVNYASSVIGLSYADFWCIG